MLLIAQADVRTRLGLDDNDKNNDAIDAAIESCTPRFEAVLASLFDEASYSDIFFVDSERETPAGGVFRLRCSNGFIKADSVVAVYAETLDDLQLAATALTLNTALIQYEKGYVSIPDTYANYYVQLSYDAGFGDIEDLPYWVKEAAFYYTYEMLTLNMSNDIKINLERGLKFMRGHATSIVDAHLRFNRGCITPIA